MQLEQEAVQDVMKRLRRVEGQIGGIVRMLEEGRDCSDVITQLAAASKALDRAGFRLIATGIRQCLSITGKGKDAPMSVEEMERLFLSLA